MPVAEISGQVAMQICERSDVHDNCQQCEGGFYHKDDSHPALILDHPRNRILKALERRLNRTALRARHFELRS